MARRRPQLWFVFYLSGTKKVDIQKGVAPEPEGGIVIKDGDWTFVGERQGRYRIGQDVREPDAGENREFWGPMMVLDPQNSEHLARFETALEEFRLESDHKPRRLQLAT